MALEINHITKKYGAKQALNDVTLCLQNGITGLLGPNGAGKSTLMRLLSTIEKPTAGSILYNGRPRPFQNNKRVVGQCRRVRT